MKDCYQHSTHETFLCSSHHVLNHPTCNMICKQSSSFHHRMLDSSQNICKCVSFNLYSDAVTRNLANFHSRSCDIYYCNQLNFKWPSTKVNCKLVDLEYDFARGSSPAYIVPTFRFNLNFASAPPPLTIYSSKEFQVASKILHMHLQLWEVFPLNRKRLSGVQMVTLESKRHRRKFRIFRNAGSW